MHRGLIAFSLFALCSLTLAQPMPDTLWTRYYGDEVAAETPRGIARTADGGYVIVGSRFAFGGRDSYFLNISHDGQVASERVNAVTGQSDMATDVCPLADNSGYMICGNADGMPGLPGQSGYTMKTFLIGTPQWTQAFGDDANDESPQSLVPADGGGSILAGWTTPQGTNDYLAQIVKVDAQGVPEWNRTFGTAGYNILLRVRAAGGDTYVAAGVIERDGQSDAYAVKISGAGDTLWTRTYGAALDDGAGDVLLLPDGGFLLAGVTESYTQGPADVYLVRTDADGDQLWYRAMTHQFYAYATSLAAGPAGGFVLTVSETTDSGELLHLVGVDSAGEELWRRTYGGLMNTYAAKVVATTDGGYCVLANRHNPGGSQDVYVIRTGPDVGFGADDPAELPREYALSAYPNPFNAQAQIRFTLPRTGDVRIGLYNVTGQKLSSLSGGRRGPGTHTVTLDGRGLASGTYLVRMETADFSSATKLVLLK